MLQFIKEGPFKKFAVNLVTLDAKSGVRLNRMDQMLGSILAQFFKNIQTPLLDSVFGVSEANIGFSHYRRKKSTNEQGCFRL